MDEMYKDIYKKLMTLQWLLRRYQMMHCKEHNIYENRNEGQGRVLALLKIQPEIATKDMSYLLGIKQQSLNELLKKLEKSGYVKRKPSKEDKRVMIVCLTEEGKKVEQKEEEYKEIFDCLTNEELEQFSSYIDRILSSLEEMVGNPLDQEAYEWMERIQSHMGREQFEKVVEEHGFGGMPFIRRGGFEHFHHDVRETAPEDLPGAERFSPDYDGPNPRRKGR